MIDAVTAERERTVASRPLAVPAWLPDLAGLAVCTLAALIALLPLAPPGMVATHDGLLHIQRLIALDDAARQGVLFPRWLPDLAYGYGEPVFLYYAPLAYLPALVARMLGLGFVGSVEAASSLALVLSGLGMYLLARSLVGPRAATVAGVVYVLLPYQLVDLYVRGALAESWAFVWLPLTAWCLLGARRDNRARWSVGLALSFAGLILTHNVTALLFTPALLALGVLLWLRPVPVGRSGWLRPIIGLAVGLGLSAWFWLPALAERSLVQIGETIEPDLFASFFFRTLPPFRLDLLYDYREPVSTALGSPIFWPQPGLVQVVVTLAGIGGAMLTRGLLRYVAIWAILLVLGGILMQLGPVARLYEVVPLLAFVQFPWRLLALVGLGTALLAAVLIEALNERRAARITLAALVIGASLVTGLARLQPDETPVDERMLSSETLLRSELADYGLGTTHSGEYVPVTSGQRNAARFRKTLVDAPTEARASGAAASSLAIQRLDWQPDRILADVQATTPDRLVIHQFAFPGWVASIDGVPAPIQPAAPLGLLAVDVPAGAHTVEFAWTQTPLRLVALVASLLTLVALPVLGGLRRRRLVVATVGCVVVAGALALVTVGGPSGTAPARESAAWQSPDDRLASIGVHHDISRLDRERIVVTDLSWLVREPARSGYQVGVQVVGSNGAIHDAAWPYQTLSRHWQRGEIVRTTVVTRLPPEFPAGPATLRMWIVGQAGGSTVDIGQVSVPPAPAAPPSPGAGAMASLGNGLSVAAGEVRTAGWRPMTMPRPGDAIDVDLTWRASSTMPDLEREYLAVLAMQAPSGDLTSEPSRPGDWFAPLPFWQAGDLIPQHLRLVLPLDVRPGSYSLVARVYTRDLARGGVVPPGAPLRVRGRPVAEIPLGDLVVGP